MPKDEEDLESLLSRAKAQEKEYDWSGGAKTYEDALRLPSEQVPFRIADILERRAYALCKAAFQAKTNEEFRNGIGDALESYQKANNSYEKANCQESKARISRCDAMISFLEYWQKDEASEKKRLIGTAWKQAIEALNGFKSSNSALDYSITFNHLWFSAAMLFNYAHDFESRRRPIMEALDYGEQAIKFLEGLEEPEELSKALVRVAIIERAIGGWLVEHEEAQKHLRKSFDTWCRAKEVSKDIAFAELGVSNPLSGVFVDLSGETSKESPVYQEALGYSRRTKDRLLIGGALEILAYIIGWPAFGIEDPEKREAISLDALKHALGARDEFAIISFQSPNWTNYWAGFPDMGHLFVLALTEIDIGRKRELLNRILTEEPEYLRRARATEYPAVEQSALFGLGVVLKELAKLENKREVKRALLEKALDYGKRQLAIEEKYDLYHFMNLSVPNWLLAELLYETAKITEDREAKIKLLREAIQHDRKAIEISTKGMSLFGASDLGVLTMVSDIHLDYGRRLRHLGQLTNDSGNLKEATEAFENSLELALKADLMARAAEDNWEAAKTYDLLQEHLKAAERFESASENYRKATEKIPGLKAFYNDFILYMSAWSEIERAKYSHARLDPESARKHYEKAASLHKSTDKWAYLSSNYAAWAEIEGGEGLSRKERPAEAVKVFENAARLFEEATRSLGTEFSRVVDPDERDMVSKLVKAAENRKHYCMARVALETAKVLGRQGDDQASSDKYGQAAEMFQKIHDQLDSEQDRRELQLIIKLAKAWQAMAKAEADGSAQAYAEASTLFEHAKDLSIGEKARSLALGHSRFAKALEIGTRFAETMDVGLHASATQQLESASVCYLKADLGSASEYAKACKHLFDGYVHMNKASKEEDQEKKVKLYSMTEKVFQASAASFDRAEQPKKKEQVLKLLEKVKEERELALSLTEVMKAPEIVSTTQAFIAPTPTHETPVGLERFEHADIQANLVAPKMELKMDEDLEIDIELVNAGRGPAQLIKLQDVLPKGFTLREEPGGYRMEDSYLNLKGRRLDPLKTEEIRLVLRPSSRGRFTLKPRILYLDEGGKYKSHEPEPLSVTVGIEPTAPSSKAVRLDTQEAAEAHSLLAGLSVVTLSHYRIVGN